MLSASDIEFFTILASSASLAEAARRVNVTPSAVTQRLQALEARIGVKLLTRSGGRLTLTDEGELVARGGERVVEAMDDLRDSLAHRRRFIVGKIRVTASFGFGRRYVAPLIAELSRQHPELVVDLVLMDKPAALQAEGYDIAFHVGPLDIPGMSLIRRKIASNVRLLCASPAYLAERGEPERVADLIAHDCITLQESSGDGALWHFDPIDGGPEERVRVKPRLSTNDGEVAKSWAIAGLGLILRSEWDVADDLRSGRLRRVLSKHSSSDWDVMALMPGRSDTTPARVRLLLDHASRALAQPPWR